MEVPSEQQVRNEVERTQVSTIEAASSQFFLGILRRNYTEDALLAVIPVEPTYESLKRLIRESGIRGKGETVVIDLDGVTNNNKLHSIFRAVTEEDALEYIRDIAEILPEANIIVITSRPTTQSALNNFFFTRPGNPWMDNVIRAIGSRAPGINLEKQTPEDVIKSQARPYRLLVTDVNKNSLEPLVTHLFKYPSITEALIALPQLFRRIRNHEVVDSFHILLEKIISTSTHITFFDSDEYSYWDISDLVQKHSTTAAAYYNYISIENNAVWAWGIKTMRTFRSLGYKLSGHVALFNLSL